MIVIWWLHREDIVTSGLWWVIRRRYFKPSGDSQVSLFGDSTGKSSWPLLCGKFLSDIKMKSPCDLSQSNGQDDFMVELQNCGYWRVTKWLHCDVNWDSSGCISHSDFTVESPNDSHLRLTTRFHCNLICGVLSQSMVTSVTKLRSTYAGPDYHLNKIFPLFLKSNFAFIESQNLVNKSVMYVTSPYR